MAIFWQLLLDLAGGARGAAAALVFEPYRLASQFGEARHCVFVGADAEVLFEQVGAHERFARRLKRRRLLRASGISRPPSSDLQDVCCADALRKRLPQAGARQSVRGDKGGIAS